MKRTKRLIITLSQEEYETIRKAAIAEGRSVSGFLRHYALTAEWSRKAIEGQEEGKGENK